MKKLLALCAATVLMIGSVSCASADVGAKLLFETVKFAAPGKATFGETVCLGDSLVFSIPEDWTRIPDEEVVEGAEFQYWGTDEDGTAVKFSGATIAHMFDDYHEVEESLEKQGSEYLSFTNIDVDIILTGDERIIGGMCLAADGRALCFLFELEGKSFSELDYSSKLLEDIMSIIFSIKATDSADLQHFDDLPEENEPESHEGGLPFPVYPTIAPPPAVESNPTEKPE